MLAAGYTIEKNIYKHTPQLSWGFPSNTVNKLKLLVLWQGEPSKLLCQLCLVNIAETLLSADN